MGNQTSSATQPPAETNRAVNVVTTTNVDPQFSFLPDKQLRELAVFKSRMIALSACVDRAVTYTNKTFNLDFPKNVKLSYNDVLSMTSKDTNVILNKYFKITKREATAPITTLTFVNNDEPPVAEADYNQLFTRVLKNDIANYYYTNTTADSDIEINMLQIIKFAQRIV